ncbi:MAG: cell division protein FtsL [Bacilli bacterium]|nr:cell division protein FtsL [Bacilli bacterium]MDD3896051.1 cell division protein FtsL [Bacilli bacterium]MDD4407892.1 cell division protein FtsL [Bacilli bacterium]
MGRVKKTKFKLMDRVMIMIIVILALATPIIIVFSKSVLSKTNIEVEKIQEKVDKQETINESITMKINELASLSNIQDVAKEYGLSYNNENILIIK